MSSFTKSMFESIKQSLESQKNSGNFRDILKTEAGNTYVVRLIPNVKNPERTFYHYYHHVWNSESTGQYVSCMCPTTWGEACPICTQRIKLYKEGTEEAKKLATILKRKENWLVNAYVVEDPKNPNNVGKIKIFRYGAQIKKIFDEAIDGDDSEQFGPAIFDLTKDGCNFRIKVETNQGGYPTYISSKFLNSKAIEGLDADKIEEIHNSIFELDKLFEISSNENIQKMLVEHTSIKVAGSVPTKSTPKIETKQTPKPTPVVEEEVEEKESSESDSSSDNIDDKISDLLKDL